LVDGSVANPLKELDLLLGKLEEGLIFLESRDYYKGDELIGKKGFVMVSRVSTRSLETFRKKYGDRLDFVRFDLSSDMEDLKRNIYNFLNCIRIYTKRPGKEADFTEPVVLKKGATVLDAAYEIHKDFADKMKYTWLWRGGNNPRQVSPGEVLTEGDVVEFHSK
jgi:ribosome-interacting GTPase 1